MDQAVLAELVILVRGVMGFQAKAIGSPVRALAGAAAVMIRHLEATAVMTTAKETVKTAGEMTSCPTIASLV